MFARILALAAVVALAVSAPVQAADWRRIVEPSIGLRFEMPAEPDRKVDEPGEGDARGDITYSIRDDDRVLAVQISQAAMDLGDPADGAQVGVDEMKRRLPGARFLSDDIAAGEVYVRRTIANPADGGVVAQVSMIRGRTLVIVLYIQFQGEALSDEGRRFLESLALERPEI